METRGSSEKEVTWADAQSLKKEIEEDNVSEELTIIIQELTRTIKKYRAALEFYANESDYHAGLYIAGVVVADKGKIAREALK